MKRRPRVVWLLDSTEPTGAAIMAMRRRAVVQGRFDDVVLTLDGGGVRPPVGSALRTARRLTSVAGEVRMARADLVVSTSPRTLLSAAARRTGRARHLHVMAQRAQVALAEPRVARGLPAVSTLAVPAGEDVAAVARLAARPAGTVTVVEDFVPAATSLPGRAVAPVVLAAGRIDEDDPIADVVDGFARAALPGWQLRIAGTGPGLPQLLDRVAAHRGPGTVLVLGARHDLPALYQDAGLVVRLAGPEADGLSVLEALAAGVPVLGSPATPAVRRLVRHGENGWVLRRTDPDSIAAALVELHDAGRRRDLAAGARTGPQGILDAATRRRVHDLFDLALAAAPPD